jgi:hypothetical protein
MKHLRLRLDLATRQTRRTLEKRRRCLLTDMTDRLKDGSGSDAYLLLRWREDVRRQRALFDTFYDQYDEMIGLLCAAAQIGIEPRMEEEYRGRRRWFTGNYPQRVRPLVQPYLTAACGAEHDAKSGFWERDTADAFEALFLPLSIDAMLAADGGNLIERMMQTQEALGAWEAHIVRQETALTEAIRFH